jgi:hypothetical protein
MRPGPVPSHTAPEHLDRRCNDWQYFGWTTKWHKHIITFIRSGQFAVKPASTSEHGFEKPASRQRELPLAKTAPPIGDGSRASNDRPPEGHRTGLQIKAAARVILPGWLPEFYDRRNQGRKRRGRSRILSLLQIKGRAVAGAHQGFARSCFEIHLPLQPKQDPIENFEEARRFLALYGRLANRELALRCRYR